MSKNQDKRSGLSSDELPQILLETANFHGGDSKELIRAVDSFSRLDYPNVGMKFHAFDPGSVSLPDFSAQMETQTFLISEREWKAVIHRANEKDFKVWLDLFCIYGVRVLNENIPFVSGIKLQPSVLDNLEIRKALKSTRLENLELIINIAGMELPEIEDSIKTYSEYPFKKVILQMGFQSFPTPIDETSLAKIDVIRSHFPEFALGYADHLDGKTQGARRFPVYAFLKGCTYLEKHICNYRHETRIDFQSALEFREIEEMAAEIKAVRMSLIAPFLSKNERDYLQVTYQKPILGASLSGGQLVAESDLLFRRTEKPGMNLKEWKDIQQNYFILKSEKNRWDTLSRDDFKKAKIAVLIAARMKSSRLPRKAILPIRGIPSIQRCLQNCIKFPSVDEVILATSTEKEDDALGDFTLGGQVKFWRGDPVDVLSRYLGACQRYKIDVVIRVTGDSPVVSPEIAGFLLKSHFASGADFTQACRFSVGTNCEVYNTEALEKVMRMAGRAEHSEHMSLYMINNQDIFKVNIADLPEEWIRDYRLTLDYKEDLEMFQALFGVLEEEDLEMSLANMFMILDRNPAIPKLNSHKTLIYKSGSALRKELDEKTRLVISKIPESSEPGRNLE
jgi:N,N'-diacetyllegionaminate synthase